MLLPGAVLPLRLFEPRYLVFIADVLAGDRRFGVTLIERGHEVGGGDVRSSFGCVAEIQHAAQLPNGQWQVAALGTERFSVTEWLADDPYARAIVKVFDDLDDLPSADELVDLRWVELVDGFRQLEALLIARTGREIPITELSHDPKVFTFEMSNVLPISPYDRQRILRTRSAEERRVLLLDVFEGITTLVQGPKTN